MRICRSGLSEMLGWCKAMTQALDRRGAVRRLHRSSHDRAGVWALSEHMYIYMHIERLCKQRGPSRCHNNASPPSRSDYCHASMPRHLGDVCLSVLLLISTPGCSIPTSPIRSCGVVVVPSHLLFETGPDQHAALYRPTC